LVKLTVPEKREGGWFERKKDKKKEEHKEEKK
jgi:hypothetical protein